MRASAIKALDIAAQLRRLRPNWGNPERYFEDRSEIERELRRLAHALRESAND
jgi:hypothetical protein